MKKLYITICIFIILININNAININHNKSNNKDNNNKSVQPQAKPDKNNDNNNKRVNQTSNNDNDKDEDSGVSSSELESIASGKAFEHPVGSTETSNSTNSSSSSSSSSSSGGKSTMNHYVWKKSYIVGPSKRHQHTATLVGNNEIFILCGCYLDQHYCYNDVWVYVITERRFYKPMTKGNIPYARGQHSSTLIGDNIYMFGGSNDGVQRNDLYTLNTKTLTWTNIQSRGIQLLPREAHLAVAYNSKLYIFGGYTPKGYEAALFSFDTKQLMWSRIEVHGFPPMPRADATGILVNNLWYVFGGSSDKGDMNDLHTLDMKTLFWNRPQTTGTDPTPRYGSLMLADPSNKWAYVIGGCSYEKESCYNETFCLDLEHLEWSKVPVFGPQSLNNNNSTDKQNNTTKNTNTTSDNNNNNNTAYIDPFNPSIVPPVKHEIVFVPGPPPPNAGAGDKLSKVKPPPEKGVVNGSKEYEKKKHDEITQEPTDFKGYSVMTQDGKGEHKHPWDNYTQFNQEQRGYQKIHGKTSINGTKGTSNKSSKDNEDTKDSKPSSSASTSTTTKGNSDNNGNSGEPILKDGATKFPVPLYPLTGASIEKGVADTYFRSRAQMAGIILNTSKTIWTMGGCFLEVNCTYEVTTLELGSFVAPQPNMFDYPNMKAPLYRGDANAPEPIIKNGPAPPPSTMLKPETNEIKPTDAPKNVSKSNSKKGNKKASLIESKERIRPTRKLDDFAIEIDEDPLSFESRSAIPVKDKLSDLTRFVSKNSSKSTEEDMEKQTEKHIEERKRVLHTNVVPNYQTPSDENKKLTPAEKILQHSIRTSAESTNTTRAKSKIPHGKLHPENGYDSKAKVKPGTKKPTPHVDELDKKLEEKKHPKKPTETPPPKVNLTRNHAHVDAIGTTQASKTATHIPPKDSLRAVSDAMVTHLFIPIIIILSFFFGCGAFVFCTEKSLDPQDI